jgi:hypothetical protein
MSFRLQGPSLLLNSYAFTDIFGGCGMFMDITWNCPKTTTAKDVVNWIGIACSRAPANGWLLSSLLLPGLPPSSLRINPLLLCYGHHESPPRVHRHAQVRETSRNGARSPGATERFLDFFDGHAVGLIVRLVILVVVSLKGKQLVSVALPDHGNVNAPFHPGF